MYAQITPTLSVVSPVNDRCGIYGVPLDKAPMEYIMSDFYFQYISHDATLCNNAFFLTAIFIYNNVILAEPL